MVDQPSLAANYLKTAKAIKVAMELSVASTGMDIGKYTSYKNFASRYNSLVDEYIARGGQGAVGVNKFDITNFRTPGSLTWPQQKEMFDAVYTEVLVFITSLEGVAGRRQQAVSELHQFFLANLRRAMLRPPECEKDVQDVVETLLIGRGYSKGTDYDRETGRVKYSGKEFVPDFIIPSQSIAVELKLVGDAKRVKDVIDEMNADIPAFRTRYERVLFVVYDLGFIRDEYEFRSGLEKNDGVDVCLVKQ